MRAAGSPPFGSASEETCLAPPKSPAFFYGWVIVAIVFFTQFFMVGFWTYGLPVLVDPVGREFGATTTEVQLGTLGGLVGAFFGPVLGPVVDRWSARWLMAIGIGLLVASIVSMSLSSTILAYTLSVGVLLSAANLLLGPITSSTLVSRFFAASRGRALGVAAIGTSLGGILTPAALTAGIADSGWRTALQLLAATIALGVLPAIIFGLRDHPSDLGLFPDGASEPPAGVGLAAGGAEGGLGEILRTSRFWMIGVSLGLLFMSYTGTLANLHKYATELGVEAPSATSLITAIAVAGIVGKLAFGWLADKISLRLGLWIAQAFAAVGIGLLSTEPTYPVMVCASLVMGIAAGGMLPVWGAMIAAAYGVANFGRVMGLMTPVIAVFAAPGPVLAARSLDLTESYAMAFQAFAVAIVVGALLLIPLRLEEDERDA